MELQILYMMQGLHQGWLDSVMIFFGAMGEHGLIWLALGLILAITPRTRKCGVSMLLAMGLTFLVGNIFLKNLIARPRPCAVDTSVQLLIPVPSGYSFPSGHTSNGFAAAMTFFFYYRVPGAAALLVAAMIAFSRMYLFVHYPTDILGGLLLGIADAFIVLFFMKKWEQRKRA